MKTLLTFILVLVAFSASAQHMSLSDWDEQAKTNKRLLPKYGQQSKTAVEKQADKDFIRQVMANPQFNGDTRAASDHLIQLGFSYLNRGDIKTAMYRFNQGYLLDSANVDCFWGFGGVFLTLGALDRAKSLYEEGLAIQPTNTRLLTDYGTCFMAQYHKEQLQDQQQAFVSLARAIDLLTTSYELDATNPNTVVKLSVCYWSKGDCEQAWRFYLECQALGGKPITQAYTDDLAKRCKK